MAFLSFKDFQAGKKQVTDLGAVLEDDSLTNEHGLVYEGNLYIETRHEGWSAECAGKGDYMLLIGNWSEISPDLEKLERELYDWGVGEGYFEMTTKDADEWRERLTAEYTQWNKDHGLDLGSADEHQFDEDLTEAQRKWLQDFVERWEEMEQHANTARRAGQ